MLTGLEGREGKTINKGRSWRVVAAASYWEKELFETRYHMLGIAPNNNIY
jgi:hypothetical protein